MLTSAFLDPSFVYAPIRIAGDCRFGAFVKHVDLDDVSNSYDSFLCMTSIDGTPGLRPLAQIIDRYICGQ